MGLEKISAEPESREMNPLADKPKMPTGGARPGSGRPRLGNVRLNTYVSEKTRRFLDARQPIPRGVVIDQLVEIAIEALPRTHD